MHTLATDLARAPGARPQRTVTEADIHPAIAAGEYAIYPTRFPQRLLYSPALAHALKQSVQRADVVHIHSLWLYPQRTAARAAAAAGVPYIVSPHGALDPALASHGGLRKRVATSVWQRQMLEGATLIHVTTDVEAQLITDVAPAVPRVVVPVGIDLHEFENLPDRNEFRRRRLDSYDGPLVLFLGRLTYKKGIDQLIKGFALLRRDIPCRLIIAGPDDESLTPSLRATAELVGVADDVVFAGPVFGEQRRAVLSSADVWALSSHTENFGVAVIEAMAAGCPVVISTAVNLAPQVQAAGAGLVTDVAPEAVANALGAILTDAALRSRLSDAGREFASRYEIDTVAASLERMYSRAADTTKVFAPS